jgi:putative transposase
MSISGYPKHAVQGRNLDNSRNGTRSKRVLTEIGPVDIDVPRDRESSFDPKTVRKDQRRLGGLDSMVISLTAKGLTTGEVEAHLAEVYSTTISRETISKITDRVLGELAEWQTRPLDRIYPVVFIDAIVVKIRDGQVANRPVYTAIGVSVDGQRDILGLWVGSGGEGVKYWLQVLTEIKNRGVDDVCIVVCDGLKGLPESIAATWPLAVVQTCVLHRSATPSALPAGATGTTWPATCARSTPPSTRPTRHGAWRSSTRSGGTATRRSGRCGPTPGRSSCRSSTTPPRSAE